MPYYDIYDSNDNLIASDVFLDLYTGDYGSGSGAGTVSFIVTMIIGYILSFIGMIIMLFNVPPYLIFPAICAFLIFLSVPLIGFLKNKSIVGVIATIAKNSYIFLSLLVGMWWVLYSLQTVSEVLLIGILVVTMYSMYLIPGVMIYESAKLESKLGMVGTGITVVTAFAVYLINYDKLANSPNFSQFFPIIFSTIMTGLGSLFIYINRLIYYVNNGRKRKGFLGLTVYLVLVLGVALVSGVFVPQTQAKSYNEAISYIESNQYMEAREKLLSLGRYSDCKELYETIKYKDLKVGEKVTFGQYFEKPDGYSYVSLTWTVIEISDGNALLFCDEIITSIDSNPLYKWQDGNNVRSKLNDIYDAFTDEDKGRIATVPVNYNTASKNFTASDKLFLLSEEELKELCSDEIIYSKDDTKYNDHTAVKYMQADFDYEYVYSYYVRGTDTKDNWIIVDCENKQFRTKNNRYVGIRPAVVIKMD